MVEIIFTVGFALTMLLYAVALMFVKSNVKIAQAICFVVVLLLSASIVPINFLYGSFFSFAYSLFVLFLIVNAARIAANRMHVKELYDKTLRTFTFLAPLAFIALLGALYIEQSIFMELLAISFVGSLILFISTIYSAYRWRPKIQSDSDTTPTVSVCIPARNETQDLPECIESVIDSDYPKLEILVLDDCSHDKTPSIIKEYAHRGVRFISGTEPDSGWLAKNQAMNKLFDESTGELVVFAGVDVRFDRQSISKIVELLQNGYDMVSILPRRSIVHELSLFIQPLRYWWELSLPRFFGGKPPSLSTCWAIKRDKLNALGEFDSYRKSVQTESHFAKHLRNTYGFIISGNTLGLSSVKGAREQYDTAIRTRYPQVKRRLELVPLLLISELVIFFLPLLGLILGINTSNRGYIYLSIVSMSFLVLINAYISYLTVYRTWLLGFITLPFLLFEEWFILLRSMFAYEFGVVMWKDRNICLPMYKVEKSLPNL